MGWPLPFDLETLLALGQPRLGRSTDIPGVYGGQSPEVSAWDQVRAGRTPPFVPETGGGGFPYEELERRLLQRLIAGEPERTPTSKVGRVLQTVGKVARGFGEGYFGPEAAAQMFDAPARRQEAKLAEKLAMIQRARDLDIRSRLAEAQLRPDPEKPMEYEYRETDEGLVAFPKRGQPTGVSTGYRAPEKSAPKRTTRSETIVDPQTGKPVRIAVDVETGEKVADIGSAYVRPKSSGGAGEASRQMHAEQYATSEVNRLEAQAQDDYKQINQREEQMKRDAEATKDRRLRETLTNYEERAIKPNYGVDIGKRASEQGAKTQLEQQALQAYQEFQLEKARIEAEYQRAHQAAASMREREHAEITQRKGGSYERVEGFRGKYVPGAAAKRTAPVKKYKPGDDPAGILK